MDRWTENANIKASLRTEAGRNMLRTVYRDLPTMLCALDEIERLDRLSRVRKILLSVKR